MCQLDAGHPDTSHRAVWPPDPGTKTQTEWSRIWTDTTSKGPWDAPFTLPGQDTPAMRAHAQLLDQPRLFICQPVAGELLYVHIRLGRKDTGLASWLRRIGVKRDEAMRTEHGDYLARGHFHGARVVLTAHAHSYR